MDFMHKDTKWAKQIISMQREDGAWGDFHTLSGKREIPDRREKLVDWDVFTSLMLSTWIRRFTKDVPIANQVADQWVD